MFTFAADVHLVELHAVHHVTKGDADSLEVVFQVFRLFKDVSSIHFNASFPTKDRLFYQLEYIFVLIQKM
jgi:hypothetical protein